MHALMQDRHNPDVAIREMSPVDEMALVSKEEPFCRTSTTLSARDNHLGRFSGR